MMRFIFAIVFCSTFPQNLWAWASRGHSLVTQVATRILENPEFDATVLKPFLMRADLLMHLSNIPDIAWKNDENIRKLLDPTHFFEIDSLPNPESAAAKKLKDLAEEIQKNLCKEKSTCTYSFQETMSKVGSAPWRVEQFSKNMEFYLRKIQSSPLDKSDTLLVNEFLKSAGLLSHFIGDLGNPHHVVKDYDGWKTGQGGLHAYFEAEIVDALPLSLAQDVFDYVQKEKPFEKNILPLIPKNFAKDPLAISIALARESHKHLETMLQIDRQHSLKKESASDGKRKRAERSAPKDVAQFYKTLIVERIGTAADTLAHVWYYTWEKAEKKDLSSYFSLFYFFNPDPVLPEYLF